MTKTMAAMSSRQLIELLIGVKPSDEAVAFLAAVIADDTFTDAACELKRRYQGPPLEPAAATGKRYSATTVAIDRERFRAYFWRQRIPLSQVGPTFGRSTCWASAMLGKGHCGWFALDELATELDLHVDELIRQIGTDDEVARLEPIETVA